MGVEAAVAIIVAAAAAAGAGTAVYSAGQQRRAIHKSENEARDAKIAADAESARLAQEAEAEAARLKNIEAETKKKMIAAQSKLPGTIATSFSGLKDPANVQRKKLLGQ